MIDATTKQAVIDNSKFYPVLNDLKKSGEPCTKPDLRMVKVQLSNGQVASITLRITDGLTVCKIRPSFENGQYRQRKQNEATYAEFSAITNDDMFERVVAKAVKVARQMDVSIGVPVEAVAPTEAVVPTETVETVAPTEAVEAVEAVAPTETTEQPFVAYMLYHFTSGTLTNANIRIQGDTIVTETGEKLPMKEYIIKPIQ